MMCDKVPQYSTKHSTPKFPNMLRSVIYFFYLSPSQYTLWSINLIMVQYCNYTDLINYPVFQGDLLEEKSPSPANPSRTDKAFRYFNFRGRVMSWGDDNWQYWSKFLKIPSSSFSLSKSTECVNSWPVSNEYLVHSPVLLPWFWYMSEDSFSIFRKMGWSWTPFRTASDKNFS